MQTLIALLIVSQLTKDSFAADSILLIPAPGGNMDGPLIVGGQDAKEAQFPYQVVVQVYMESPDKPGEYGHFMCGGSVLCPAYVLTAAHCFKRKHILDKSFVFGGFTKISERQKGLMSKIAEAILHENYFQNRTTRLNDIALVKPAQPLKLSQTVAVIPIQKSMVPPGTQCTTTGWGWKSENDSTIPDVLQYITVPIIPQYLCKSKAPTVWLEGFLCAGALKGDKGPCTGDSGGPLVCDGKLTGVVSWGWGCAWKQNPDFYSDVFYYNKWIDQKTQGSCV